MALSLPDPDTVDAGIISKRWRNIDRNSLDGSALNSYSQSTLRAHNRKLINTEKHVLEVNFHVRPIPNKNMNRVQTHQGVWLHLSL